MNRANALHIRAVGADEVKWGKSRRRRKEVRELKEGEGESMIRRSGAE